MHNSVILSGQIDKRCVVNRTKTGLAWCKLVLRVQGKRKNSFIEVTFFGENATDLEMQQVGTLLTVVGHMDGKPNMSPSGKQYYSLTLIGDGWFTTYSSPQPQQQTSPGHIKGQGEDEVEATFDKF